MPLYEYRCKGCGKVFEVIQKYSDTPLTMHEECGASVEKLLSAPSFHLKGTGWYATDYARSGASKDGKAENSAASETKGDTKADTKGETKGGTKGETQTSESSKPAATPAPASKTD
ncbi:MAG: zinc ribbon domain-containing protein [Acidobacteriia bacterium]|nr:zinc ribbon domain-containing protein [Terriglobia bacterium]